MTLADGKFAGELKSTVVKGGGASGDKVPHTFAIDARVLGGRYLFGQLTLTVGDATSTGFVRGGIVPADNPATGITAEMAARFVELFPKKKKGAP